MHWLTIEKLGPIQHCQLPIRQYTVLTGFQAAGKSTVAKAIYFFRTLKDDIYQLIQQQEYSELIYGLKYAPRQEDAKQHTLYGDFESFVRNKFLSTFGSSYSMDKAMRLCYQYSDNVEITISLAESRNSLTPNFVWVEYSPCIRKFLSNSWPANNREALRRELDALFDDPYETVYIPAGRSVLTVLGSQFNYFYSTMDDAQKRLLDACTRDYLERVMRLRPQFANGLEGLAEGRYALPGIPLEVHTFKGEKFNQKELEQQLRRSGSFTQMMARSELDNGAKRPLLPLSISQIGLIGGSGMINGLIECDTPHIIKGRIVKVKRLETEEKFSPRGKHMGSEVRETISNKMIFNVLTPNGFKALT